MSGDNDSQQSEAVKLRPASERLRELMWDFQLPGLVKRVLPRALLARMYEKREHVEKRLSSCELSQTEKGWYSVGLSRTRVFKQAAKDKLAGASMSIIVAIHDAPSVTKRCLSSLELYAAKSEVFLIDDGSRMTETKDLIRDFSSRNSWTAIRNSEARGHSAACEAGARLASRPYLCLLNSDTLVTPWCWGTIEQAFATDARIGIAGPSTSASGNQQTIPLAEYCRFYWNDSQIYAFAKRQKATRSRPAIVDLPWADGFAFFIRRSLWQQLGGFDPNLPDYGNEIDLCKRAANLGYRIVLVRKSYIHHLRHQSYVETIGQPEIHSRISAACHYISQRHSTPSVNSPVIATGTAQKRTRCY